MAETLMDRRAVFMRISSESDLIGKASVKPDEYTIIRYNNQHHDISRFRTT